MNFMSKNGQLPLVRPKSSDYLLVTGATGLLGRYLLRDLLMAGQRVAVLVRNGRDRTAVQRIESQMQMWEQASGRPFPRPIVLTGDVTRPMGGLCQEDLAWCKRHVVSILHSAAMVRFDTDTINGEPERTNLGGTRNMLQLAVDLQIDDFQYVSTAFVCGDRDGVILESDLEQGQGFHNAYEQSKFQAEQAVRQAHDIHNRTVYRPSIITADSRTGYTNTYFGIMWYLKLLSVLIPQQPVDSNGIRQTPIDLPVSGNEPHNLVPVDWVSSVIVSLSQNPDSRGQTFHLASPHSVTMREVIDVCYEYFGSTGVRFVGDQPNSQLQVSEFAKNFFESSRNYRAYDSFTPVFDRTHLDRLAGHLSCPRIDRDTILRFLEFGKRDRWGKRRMKEVPVSPQTPPQPLSDMLIPGREKVLQRCINGYSTGVGVDLIGPGGGQWRLIPDPSSDSRQWQLERGLGPVGLPVKSLTLGEFAARYSGD